MQGDPGLPGVEAARVEWIAVLEDYKAHVQKILPALPPGARKFCHATLHDGQVERISRSGEDLSVRLSREHGIGETNDIEIILRKIQSSPSVPTATGCWLHEEVHLRGDGMVELHVLLHDTEFVVVAKDIEIVRADRRPRSGHGI